MYLNKTLIQQLLRTKPCTTHNKILFITNDKKRAEVIGIAGYKCILLETKDNEHYYDIETFISYLNEIAYTGQYRNDYIYLQTCLTKNMNDKLKDYFEKENLEAYPGWKIFYKNEYLANNGEESRLEQAIKEFLRRFKGNDNENLLLNLNQFHVLNDKNEPVRPFDAVIVKHIKKNYPLFIMGGIPYLYEGGAYFSDMSGAKLCSIIKKYIFPKYINYNTVKRIYNLFFTEADLIKEYSDINLYPESWICFKNCMYDGRTGQTYALDPKYYSLNQVPWNYEPDNKCNGETTEVFLNSALQQDDIKTIFETFGLFMTRDNTFQKFLLLTGGRGTGKSILLKIYSFLLGLNNISNIPLQKLEEKFNAIQLLGKLANICGDLPGTALKEVGKIKELTGGDIITDSFKGKDIISFTSYVRLIFSCNTIPVSLDEKSNAFFERLIIIRMDNRPSEPDRQLDRKILNEMPYIINKSLEFLKILYAENKIYESDSSIKLVNDLYSDSDSVQAFFTSNIIFDVKQKIRTKELFDKYVEYCQEQEREPLSKNNFYRNVKGKGIGKKTIHGVDFFSGIGWNFDSEGGFLKLSENERTPFD